MSKQKSSTKVCKYCKSEIPSNAKNCPHCGKKQGTGCLTKILIALVVIIAIGVIGSGGDDSGEKAKNEISTESVVEQSTEKKGTTEVAEPTEATEGVQEKADSTTKNSNEKSLTAGEQNALDNAKNYLSYSAFSHDGLVEQLKYENFTDEEAQCAADNCGADWNEQALKKAEDYLDYSAFSYDGLIKQLEYEKFTEEQAAYGADNCGADWNEQAAKKAEEYLDYSSFSRDGLIQQLEYEGFTNEEAEYGADSVGL